jgi:COX assembly mitochondrial protein 1
MNALSRREEDTLAKVTKARALRECDPVVKGTPFDLPWCSGGLTERS